MPIIEEQISPDEDEIGKMGETKFLLQNKCKKNLQIHQMGNTPTRNKQRIREVHPAEYWKQKTKTNNKLVEDAEDKKSSENNNKIQEEKWSIRKEHDSTGCKIIQSIARGNEEYDEETIPNEDQEAPNGAALDDDNNDEHENGEVKVGETQSLK